MAVRFELDTLALERLNHSIQRLPGLAEDTINATLKKKAGKLIVSKITPLIPVSRYGMTVRDKIHAAQTKWSRQANENLGISIIAKGGAAKKKGSFGYLLFPNEGRGTHNRQAQNFLEFGRDASIPLVVEEIENDLIKKIEEELQ